MEDCGPAASATALAAGPSRGPARRRLLAAAGAALAVGRAGAQAALRLRFAHGAAEDNPRHQAALLFARKVGQASAGRIVVDVHPASRLADDTAALQGLRDGRIDLSANSQGPTAAVVPEYAAIGLPYVFDTQQQLWRVLAGPTGDELRRRSAEQGLRVLAFWDNGFRHLTNSRRAVRVPADMAGLRIRTPADPVTTALMRALGAEPVVIGFSELPAALASGRADGQENPLINIYTARLQEVQRHLALTHHKVEITPLLMAEASWSRLSTADRSLLRAAADEAAFHQRQAMLKAEERCFSRLAEARMQVSHIDMAQFQRAAAPVVEQWRNGPVGAFTQRLVAAASASRRA